MNPLAPAGEAWRDPARPGAERVADLLARMTLAEKTAQLAAVWLDAPADDGVAPAHPGLAGGPVSLAELAADGLGQLTRVLGTAPVRPEAAAAALARLQKQVTGASRFGLPAIAHEECLTGLNAWSATVFPTPLAWGASFDPDAVREMAAAIGASMRALGIHQGLAPVLDVARDARWGRVEETIGEDPYLVAVLGTAYVLGLQSAGVIATLKHFAGYSASRAGRNLAPVDLGPRELADVILPPFEMAIRDGGARSVMAAYTSLDGVPAAADPDLLTARLRGEYGFDGVVVSDYYGISFLQTMHQVAGSCAGAAGAALAAGVDVELPHRRCFGAPLADAVRAGQVPESLVDRAAGRVLSQKCQLGMLDPGWSPGPAGPADLDPPAHRRLARRLAEESVVLLANDQHALPLPPAARLAVIGPLADDPLAFFGCYTFPRHVGYRHPGYGIGVESPSLLTALRDGGAAVSHARGCDVQSGDRSGFPAAAACAAAADLVVAVVGDEAGLFGRGTSGEGCDATDLRLPGVQADLLELLLAGPAPVVLVVISGRPYALGQVAGRVAAAVQTFFPGEEGAAAIAGVLSGRVVPSGKLPIEVPALPGAQPSSYLRAPLAARTEVSSVDPTPLFPFGHGLSYTTFSYSRLTIDPPRGIPTDGTATISATIRNDGALPGCEVVQLYLRDPVAQVVRPQLYLAGFCRVPVGPGQARPVTFTLHADRTAFAGRDRATIVEPGLIEVLVGASAADIRLRGDLTLHGPERVAGPARVLTTPVTLGDPVPAGDV
jgi:beta-xylosidase